MIERKLDDIAMSTVMGQSAIEDMLINGYTWQEQAQREGELLARFVVSDLADRDVKSLRAHTKAFGDLDAQAVDVAGGPIWILEGYDVVEAVARRIGHHAGKIALGYVKTSNARVGFRNRINRVEGVDATQMPGMGRLELHDIRALSEEAEQVE